MLRITIALGVLACAGTAAAALPTFENQTPTGFSTQDSTDKQDFVEGQAVTVRVDLNQAATPTYPVIGNFHNLETAGILESRDVDGLRADVAVSDGGIIHTAWITQDVVSPVTTPVYNVRYARSNDGGGTFSSPVSVSGSLRFDLLTIDGGGPSFSTVDIEVDSRGNPRVVYAFNHSPDGHTVGFASNPDNVYFNHSENGGASWLPNNSAIRVNDIIGTATNTEGLLSAFPRMAIDQRDNIYITYVRGATTGGGAGTDDVMLAKVNRSTSPFTMEQIGSAGTIGSSGGVRIATDGVRQTGPDIDVGTGDVLHIIYFREDVVSANSTIEHKTLLADYWDVVDASGWNQGVDGATVDGFDPEPATNALLEQAATFFFPGIAVDQVSSPDRVYAFYKFAGGGLETVFFNDYVYDNAIAGNAGWLPAQASAIWSTASSAVFDDGDLAYNIELDWTVTERVEAVIDDRRSDRGDVHIVFTAGYSNEAVAGPHEHDIYYAFYNGVTWTLPEKVADDDSDSGTEDGIRSTDTFLAAPAIAKGADSDNLFMVFAGGTAEGLGVSGVTDADHHAYFKVLGRAVSSEDVSIPVGGYQYDLDYTPVNPHNATADIDDQAVWVHVADNVDGGGLGATGKQGDGFLAGDWETVAAFTLADDDKFFEGRINEDASNTHEWGDDNDKIGLLVKLNVLGTDSASNLQVVNNSTASDAGSGKGARTISVGAKVSTFIAPLDFFLLGADIDIVDSNTAPTVKVIQPDGAGDVANESYSIKYTLTDPDDDISTGGLLAALYFSEHRDLSSVQDIRIFATLIVDENDVPANNPDGTDDFEEGSNRDYTWADPSDALKTELFASIYRVPSGSHYIYLVADDGSNPPVFAVSPGPLNIVHSPIVQQVDPIVADTVDSGVRTGLKANPYDLDFSVVDYDSDARVQLFYATVSGITSVSVAGVYPNQRFALGKSVAGTRGIAITDSTTLTDLDREFAWDITDSVFVDGDSAIVADGTYYLYAVATDSVSVSVGNSATSLVVKHSPSFAFFEPAKDTQRELDSGSQAAYTIQWQKGPGDDDYDDDASIDLYFTTDDPAVVDHSTAAGAATDALINDGDTKTIVTGLTEDGDEAADMYVWNLQTPPNNVPESGQQVWLYAVTVGGSDTTVARGGAVTMTHTPFVQLNTRMPEINQGDVIRLEWDGYMVDDGVSTDDAHIRLYASTSSGLTTAQDLEANLVGGGGAGNTYIINSSDGTANGTITAIRETDEDAFSWDTETSTFILDEGDYSIYAAISGDPTFADNTQGRVSESSNRLTVKTGQGITPNMVVSPNELVASVGDTLTFEVLVQTDGIPATMVSAIMNFPANLDTVSFSPFTDLGNVFAGGTVIEDTTDGNQLRFTKTGAAEIVGATDDPARLASFQMVVTSAFNGIAHISFDDTEAALSIVGRSTPLTETTGMSSFDAKIQSSPRGRILANVLLEGRAPPVGNGNHATLMDVHLRIPGSTIDIDDAIFSTANDDVPGTADTVEVKTSSSGGLSLYSVPQGRYVLTFKDSSHLSGRTDTLTIRNGETVVLTAAQGLFASDIRGDASFLLGQDGKLLKAGDATGDNEIDEDDINAIDAAWGTDDTRPQFACADLNNDGRVGVEDLTVTTSNISNSTGFGAPPVFKAVEAEGDGPGLELSTPGFEGEWRRGSEIELRLTATGLQDLAGYSLELDYDPADMQIVRPPTTDTAGGHLFAPNPSGFFEHLDVEPGRVAVAAARFGRDWSAAGDGEVLTLRIRLNRDGFPESLRVRDGKLLSSTYEQTALEVAGDPTLLALPREFAVRQNFPNPFNPTTTIPFEVPAILAAATGSGAVPVSVEIFNALGQRVRTLVQDDLQAGYHRALWDGRNAAGQGVATGIYLYRVRVGEMSEAGRMTLLK